MKVPRRYLKEDPRIFKVIGLSFKPQITTSDFNETTSIGIKVGDWEKPINFIPYFQASENASLHVH